MKLDYKVEGLERTADPTSSDDAKKVASIQSTLMNAISNRMATNGINNQVANVPPQSGWQPAPGPLV